MGRCLVDISMSVDGFIATLDGDASAVHQWYFDGDVVSRHDPTFRTSPISAFVIEEIFRDTGALIVGRRTYDATKGWKGNHPMGTVPVFVVTHRVPKDVPEGITPFTFVLTGVESAVDLASATAAGRDVVIMGGADIVRSCLRARLVDEMHIHLAPVLLGRGIPLFDGEDTMRLEQIGCLEAPGVTHLRYRVI